jgi:acylglycerol lipase
MDRDPLIANENQTAKTVAELIRADERLRAEFPGVTLPLLVLHGTKGKAARPSGSQFFYDTAGSSDKTLKLYDGAFHDPLNDVGREAVSGGILNWIDAHLTA